MTESRRLEARILIYLSTRGGSAKCRQSAI